MAPFSIPLMTLLVTGGAGFIGANFVLDWLATSDEPIINLDKLTYAGNPETLTSLQGDARHQLVQGDIGDSALVSKLRAGSTSWSTCLKTAWPKPCTAWVCPPCWTFRC